MKNVDDLISSAKTVHARYAASRMERETVREWVLGLSEYREPYATAVRNAMNWFKPLNPRCDPALLKADDLDCLRSIFEAGDAITMSPSKR
jgi:hypothetical protein